MHRAVGLGIATLVVNGAAWTAAMATPGSGASRTSISRSAVIVSEESSVVFRSGLEAEVIKVVLEPGGTTGWHSHPGPGIFSVNTRTMSNYGLDGEACEPVEIGPGEGYFVSEHPHHPHLARNEGTEAVEVTVTYFNVPPGAATRIDAERPAECPTELN